MGMNRGVLLLLWGWIVIWSVYSGRLDLLLRGAFHSLVGASGVALILAGIVMFHRSIGRRERTPWTWFAGAVMALLVLAIPPNPSFSDLASTRPEGLPEPPDLAFVLPPEQRTLTEWVRLLRAQPDPDLVEGNPVNISGFVLKREGQPPQIARLTVRCAWLMPHRQACQWPGLMTPNRRPMPGSPFRGTWPWRGTRAFVGGGRTNDDHEHPRPERPLEP